MFAVRQLPTLKVYTPFSSACVVEFVASEWFVGSDFSTYMTNMRLLHTHGHLHLWKMYSNYRQYWVQLSSLWRDAKVKALSPEFLLWQVEFHEFILLVLLVQSGDDCFRLLVAWLFHKRLNVLLENTNKMWSITYSTWCANFNQDGSLKHLRRFYISRVSKHP